VRRIPDFAEKSSAAPNDLALIATWDLFYDVQWEFILNYLPEPSGTNLTVDTGPAITEIASLRSQ
jgi:hypothetical protein